MTSNRARIRATLHISSGNLDTDAVSRALGMDPDEAHTKGDRIGSRGVAARESYWAVSVERTAWEIESAVVEVIDKIWPRRAAVATLRTEEGVDVSLILWVTNLSGWPVTVLSAETIGRLGALGASLDMDFAE